MRLARLRDVMSKHEAGICLLTSRANIAYFTGLTLRNSDHLHFASIITSFDVTNLTAADVTDLHVFGMSGIPLDGRGISSHINEFYSSIGGYLASCSDRIAIDCDVRARRFLTRAQSELPQAGSDRIRNLSSQIMRMRRKKSEHEIAQLRQAARCAYVGAEAALNIMKEDVKEYKVTMHATKALVRAIAKSFPFCDVNDSKN